MGRWTTTAEAPSEQTFELPAYSTAEVQNEPDVIEARRQVQHANEQLDLAGRYPSRKAATAHHRGFKICRRTKPHIASRRSVVLQFVVTFIWSMIMAEVVTRRAI